MEQAPTGDIIAISSNLQKGFYVTAYKPDLTESVRKYGNTNTIATQRLKGIAPLRNGKVIVNLVNRNDATNAWYPLTMLFKPSGGLDSAYGTNGIDFRKDIFPDTATRFSEFSTIETAEDREGQVMTAAVSEKNYMQDIVLFRELYNDEAIDSLPSPPVIRANAVCDGSAVTLLANSPGCSTCLYTWSNGQTGKNISVSDAGTFTVTAANASGSATSSYTVTMSVKPQITINNPTGPVCAGKEVTLTANGADRYTWSGPDIVYVNGNVMKILPLVSGEYEVLAEKNGCAVADTFFLQVKAAVTPTVDIQYSGCPSDSLRFTAALTNTGNNPVVTWYRNDSIAGTGQVIRLTGLNNNDVIRCIVMPDVFCTSIDTVSTTLVLNCIKEVAGGNGSIGSVSVTPNP